MLWILNKKPCRVIKIIEQHCIMLADGHSMGESYSCIAAITVLLGNSNSRYEIFEKLLLICFQQTADILKESYIIG